MVKPTGRAGIHSHLFKGISRSTDNHRLETDKRKQNMQGFPSFFLCHMKTPELSISLPILNMLFIYSYCMYMAYACMTHVCVHACVCQVAIRRQPLGISPHLLPGIPVIKLSDPSCLLHLIYLEEAKLSCSMNSSNLLGSSPPC